MQWLKKIKSTQLAYLLWLLAIGGVLGSLVMSSILGFIPCELCWYQRAFMFPLPFVIGAAVYLNDKNLAYYVLPLSLTGAAIALYHLALQWGIITKPLTECVAFVPCDERYINIFGFITIPFLSLLTFGAIALLAFAHYKLTRRELA